VPRQVRCFSQKTAIKRGRVNRAALQVQLFKQAHGIEDELESQGRRLISFVLPLLNKRLASRRNLSSATVRK
jgi:hypothetical protein